MSGETKTAFGDGRAEGPCTGATVYFHVCNMVPVRDLEDASKTSVMENVQLSSNGFYHLLDFARVGHHRHNDRGQKPKFNL